MNVHVPGQDVDVCYFSILERNLWGLTEPRRLATLGLHPSWPDLPPLLSLGDTPHISL
jgi:hypothetical protein